MKLSQLASSDTTTLALLHPLTKEVLPVTITGYTPDSVQWRNAQKDISDPKKKQSLILEKGRSHIEIDSDSADKRRLLLARVVTDISGLDDWEFSPTAVEKLFEDPQYSWIHEQWSEHLDARENFFEKPARPAPRGSKSLPG